MLNGPRRDKTCHWGFANNKDADQQAHPGRLISTLLLAYWKVLYLNLLRANFNILASLCS